MLARAEQVLESALTRLLRPLVRLLLKHSVSFAAFEEIAKRVYVEAAMSELGIEGKPPSMSRAAILTGLTRKEVARLLADPPPRDGEQQSRYNRAARVLTGWQRDPDFLDAAGRPRALQDEGPGSFAELVKRHSGDMPPRAVLDELLRVGAVVRRRDGRLKPQAHAYVPSAGVSEKLAILGNDVADLIATIDHNIEHGALAPRFQRKVMYHRLPAIHLRAFQRMSAAQSQALLEQLDRWLDEHDTAVPDDAADRRTARVGVGIHYFEELGPAQPAARPTDPEAT